MDALSALAQPTRLAVFRLLVAHEPKGLPAGEVADAIGVPQNTMSAHLSILARARLVSSNRHGRAVVYRADVAQLSAMVLFLLKDCCGGRPEICAPLAVELDACCKPARAPLRTLGRRASPLRRSSQGARIK